MKELNGLSTINIELTSLCNKNCWMCGRRKIDKDYPDIVRNYGNMNFNLVEKISKQIPENIVVQFHNNGEPLLYPRLGDVLQLFTNQIRCFNTNAKLLYKKRHEIIDNLDTLTISIIENDAEEEEQYINVKLFLEEKKDRKPFLVYRCLGNVDITKWEKLPGIFVKRILHNPMGSFNYTKETTIPEIGICWDFLHHLAIDRFGDVSICVRFDPKREGVIGNVNHVELYDLWNSKIRKTWLQYHINNCRKDIPLCSKCDFWGVPRG